MEWTPFQAVSLLCYTTSQAWGYSEWKFEATDVQSTQQMGGLIHATFWKHQQNHLTAKHTFSIQSSWFKDNFPSEDVNGMLSAISAQHNMNIQPLEPHNITLLPPLFKLTPNSLSPNNNNNNTPVVSFPRLVLTIRLLSGLTRIPRELQMDGWRASWHVPSYPFRTDQPCTELPTAVHPQKIHTLFHPAHEVENS